LIDHIESECSPVCQETIYDDMLDECYSFEAVGGPFACMSASRVLKEVDPTAYRCGMNDYFGTDDTYTEVGAQLYERREVATAQAQFVEELESEASDLEKEIEECNEDSVSEKAELERRLLDLQADIKAVEKEVL